jgi:hypothetical protein
MARTLKPVSIPKATPNQYGVTVTQGEFDSLRIKIPKTTDWVFGTSFELWNGSEVIHQVYLFDPGDMPTEYVIKPYQLKCCWQQLYYTLKISFDWRTSEPLYLLLKTRE